ncbi:unnamed protein product, partial [Choristocarpus tenellus]
LLGLVPASIHRSRIRVAGFFCCDDKLRSGSMSRERFGRCLLAMGFRVSPSLCECYAAPFPFDDGGLPFVRYSRLMEELEGVFTVRQLEKHPECDVEGIISKAKVSSPTMSVGQHPFGSHLSEEDEGAVAEVMRDIHDQTKRCRVELIPTFRDFDRFNRGTLPATIFERALSILKLLPSRRKTKLLCHKFAERFSVPDQRLDVNYTAFV